MGELFVNYPSARCRLVYHGIIIISPPFLKRYKELILLIYVKLKLLLILLFSFMEHILIPPSLHLGFISRRFMSMNLQFSFHK